MRDGYSLQYFFLIVPALECQNKMANADLDRKLICTFSLKAPSVPLLSQPFLFPSTLVPFQDIPTCCFVELDVAEDGQDPTDSGDKEATRSLRSKCTSGNLMDSDGLLQWNVKNEIGNILLPGLFKYLVYFLRSVF